MALLKDYTAMRLWDRAAAVLDAIVTAVAFSESNDFTTDIMATMDATLAKIGRAHV